MQRWCKWLEGKFLLLHLFLEIMMHTVDIYLSYRGLEPDIDQLSVTDLVQLEKQLHAALTQTRDRKTQLMMQSVNNLHEQERMLREENELLKGQIAAMKRNDINETNEVREFISNDANNNMIHQSTLDLLTVGKS
ncbi:hypothetical protein FNV43_RR25756 [Rhamnella rubrinervis]|uniref:K-box domain-containing protein n=1 Tax=Rhamnella rubrinervis TaxID=2594499 RepID=A0A8K0DLN6_9ROSA|nr:hypothetical protein FNV43_RR25756 [Rhamnella rubrinervis]